MKTTINVSKKHIEGVIKKIDNQKYFMLDKIERKDLFNFALALGVNISGIPTELESHDGLFRTSYLGNDMSIYGSLLYQDVVKKDDSRSDLLSDGNQVIQLAEQYANTGFGVLNDYMGNYSEDALVSLLIEKCDKLFAEYEKDQK